MTRTVGRTAWDRVAAALEILAVWAAWTASNALAAGITGGYGKRIHGLEHLFHFAISVPLLVLAIALLVRLRGERLADIGLRAPESGWRRAIVTGLVAGLAVHAGSYAASTFLAWLGLGSAESVFDLDEWSSLLAFFASGALAGGFAEELLYRGFLLSRFEILFQRRGDPPHRGTLPAILATSAWFAATHAYQGALGVAVIALIGLAMGGLFLMCRRNLVPVMIAHASADVLAFATAFGG